jgi:peptidyl-prolyl cis-trans isomerase B (cyclophilin B)
MARKAAATRRRRQIQAAIGSALALVLVVVGAVWAFGGFSGSKKPAAAPDTCVWTPQNASANTNVKDVGTPPTKNIPTSGTATMTVSTNQGVVGAALDVAKAPCATASLTYLANQGFYGNTECHELLTGDQGMYALRCGDPSGTGSGGPTYTFYDENVPSAPDPSASAGANTVTYPKGTVAMATDTPGANGSQFFIFYQDSTPATPQYSIVGTVSSGLEVVEKIAKAGTVDNGSGAKTKPKLGVKIQNLTVTGPASPSAPAPSSSS